MDKIFNLKNKLNVFMLMTYLTEKKFQSIKSDVYIAGSTEATYCYQMPRLFRLFLEIDFVFISWTLLYISVLEIFLYSNHMSKGVIKTVV